ncbi:MAG TPA: amidophosphoribosyltransferase [Firmicutes bacterium]|nr:amidophosphoribosyltransferase [Bacillota bacterium]
MSHLFLDKPEEACGLFGVYGAGEETHAAALIYMGLYALQHRGQESAGIVVSDGEKMAAHRDMGLVSQVFDNEILNSLQGRIGIGHVRYSPAGATYKGNTQPLFGRCSRGYLAMAHNGNLVNADELRRELLEKGSIFQTTTDTEIIMNLLAGFSNESLVDAVIRTVEKLEGAFSLVVVSGDTLIGVRDPHGMRPLCLGKLNDTYLLSSESCAFTSLGAKFIRDLHPGEVVVINKDGVMARELKPAAKKALCVFEYIYFARPDSVIDGLSVHEIRKQLGRQLAREFTGEADVVVPVPDTGIAMALGFAEASGIPYDVGLYKNTYVGRTFIQPSREMRDLGVRIKLNPVEKVIRDRRVVIIDDTIVRGTTSANIIHLLREAGAREVHLCISAPPITHPCYYGIDTSVRKELIAASHTVDEIRRQIGVDTLTYLSVEGLKKALDTTADLHCFGCFGKGYPIPSAPEKKGEG